MAQGKTVLILGGGIGGIVAASQLRRALPREHRIVLVEQASTHLFQPSLLWLMLGLRTPRQISRPYTALARRGIERVQGRVERIDPLRRAVSVDGKVLIADYLVIALGAELAPDAVPGLAEAGHNLYSLAGAEAIRDARLGLTQGRVAVLVSAMPFKCPAAPYEAAMLLEWDTRRRGLRDQIQIDLYSPEPGPMPVAGAEASAQVRAMVEQKGIGYHPQEKVASVDPGARRIHFDSGASADFDLLVYVPPHRAPQAVRDAGLCGDSGWVAVDRATLATSFPGVYAIGDVTGIPLAIGKPLPKAGVLAHGQAEVIAHNIAADISGAGTMTQFQGEGACFIEAGDGQAGFGSGNFYAEPAPRMKLRPAGRLLHWGKVAYEKYWLFKWF
ncbi:MAG: pyridine nucleotide-disulfide oxidoreductase [Hydrogenophilales bacterium 17-61-9]|nr:MAG: pyridine nucleotide-disulfide oxidoreductase [Hydrogenophilales bacterium 17-61-9]